MEPRNILLVDDDRAFCDVLQVLLGEMGYEVVTETDGRNTLKLLKDGEFDVLLLDLLMPAVGGLDLLAEVRQHFSILPIVVVTGHDSAETTIAAMRGGATDFVSKPVDEKLLDLRIRRAFDLEQARRLANTDGLTGLYNHRHLQERLADEIQRAERYGRPLSVVMADLDRFKRYNDAMGHPRGDDVLISVAGTLRKLSRATDVVARYGGEEFTLILPETPLAQARRVAERARECVEALDIVVGDGGGAITLSAGVACHTPGRSPQRLLELADEALYRAKRAGRNRVMVLEESEPVAIERRNDLELRVVGGG